MTVSLSIDVIRPPAAAAGSLLKVFRTAASKAKVVPSVRQWSSTWRIPHRARAEVGHGFRFLSSQRLFPTVTFSQSSWPPQTGWTGSPPPGYVADQIKAAVEGALQPSVGQQADAYRQTAGAGQIFSAAALLASGQRVPAALKSFAPTGTTPRSLGRTPSRPELIDTPHYILEVELHFPNLAPITGRAVQPVPVAHVPSLGIGLPLICAVDPAAPSHRFVVDWDAPRA